MPDSRPLRRHRHPPPRPGCADSGSDRATVPSTYAAIVAERLSRQLEQLQCVQVMNPYSVESDHSAKRIVSLQPSATVILAALGELQRVVACTKYCLEVCPEAGSGRQIVADSWTASTSQILSANPELVIASVPYQEKAVIEILKSGVRFLALAPKTLSDIYTDIATIAGTVGRASEGERIVAEVQNAVEAVRLKTNGSTHPTVFCEEWGKPLIASQPWVAELVQAAGGEFVGDPGKQISLHEVAKRNPDVLIAAWCGAGDRVPLEKVIRDRGWQQLRAAQSRRVYCIRDEFLNTPAPTLVDGLAALTAAIHGDEASNIRGLRRIAASTIAR
jgi:iron complex transport system substrate-binding protein